MDCSRCLRRVARESTHRWSHFFHECKLPAAALASILDLYWLQPHCFLAQRIWQLATAICDERSFRLVNHRIHHHLYHSLGMLVSKLREWQIRLHYIHQWCAIDPVMSPFLSASEFQKILRRLSVSYTAGRVFSSAPCPQETMLIHSRVQSLAGQEGLGGFLDSCKRGWDLQGTMPLRI